MKSLTLLRSWLAPFFATQFGAQAVVDNDCHLSPLTQVEWINRMIGRIFYLRTQKERPPDTGGIRIERAVFVARLPVAAAACY